MTYPALLPPDDIARLRETLQQADYTSEGVAHRLGLDITAAVGRNDFRAALRATENCDPLDTLIRLFICGQTEPESTVRGVFTDLDSPLLHRNKDGIAAALELEPYGENRWILSDKTGGVLDQDHVLGIGGASTTLANAVIREPVDSALDLGTGCGVQAMHLSDHAHRVTATDISDRALTFASTAAQLAGLDWDLRRGDMITPVRGERFDLVVSNPPFVAGPGATSHTYRDSGRPGDAISAELAQAAPTLLNPGGTLQFLANWLHVKGEDWAERVAGWFHGTGMDVWIIQREISDPMAYVDLWLNDAGQNGDPQRAAAWLDWFDAQGVEAIGFGLVTAMNNHHSDPVVRAETLRQPLAHPFGPQVAAWFDRQDWLRRQTSDELLDTRYMTAPGLTLHQEADRTGDGWDVTRQVLTQTEGLGWSEEIDPVLLALVSGCDGTVTAGDQLSVMAAAYDEAEATLRAMGVVLLPHLIERGFVLPVEQK